jgi:hypothetical protein
VKAKKKKGSKKTCIDNNDKANTIHLIHFKTLGIYEQQQQKNMSRNSTGRVKMRREKWLTLELG